MIKKNCSLIGIITKPHGIGGKLVVRMNGDYADDIEPGEPLFVKVDEKLVPFFIEEAEVYPDRAILKLEFISNPFEAQKYSGMNVYLPATLIEKKDSVSADNPAFFVGYSIKDINSGIEGVIKEFIDNPFNPLFLVTNESSEFLLPVLTDFILEVDHKRKMIVFELPEGLTGL